MNSERKNEVLHLTEEFVKDLLEKEATGHDWHHINRVRNTAMYICQKEGGDAFLVEMIALLHDVADHKLHDSEDEGKLVLDNFLKSLNLSEVLSQNLIATISGISFKGLKTALEALSLEGQIVQDADRIDAIGAIGIARTFAYGGNKNRLIYDPNENPEAHADFESYKSSKSCTVNHFYEKLLHLKDRLNTSAAIEIANQRHQYMEQFLEQFYHEWNFPNA